MSMIYTLIAATSIGYGAIAQCPTIRPEEHVSGVKHIYDRCVVESAGGTTQAAWVVSVITRYKTCSNTPEARRAADEWQRLAEKNGNPDAILNAALSEYRKLEDPRDSISTIRKIVERIDLAANGGSADARYELYSFQQGFDWVEPPIKSLGSVKDAMRNLVAAADGGSYMASSTLAGIYRWAVETDRGSRKDARPDDGYSSLHFGRLVSALADSNLLQTNFRKAAEHYLVVTARLGRPEAMDELVEGYSTGSFIDHSPTDAAAWEIVRQVAAGDDAKKIHVSAPIQDSVCGKIRSATKGSSIFHYWKPELLGSNSSLAACFAFPEVEVGPSCLDAGSIQSPPVNTERAK